MGGGTGEGGELEGAGLRFGKRSWGRGESLKGGASVWEEELGEGEEFEGRGFRLGRGESLEMDVVTAAQD